MLLKALRSREAAFKASVSMVMRSDQDFATFGHPFRCTAKRITLRFKKAVSRTSA
jgi:hypothetical protein